MVHGTHVANFGEQVLEWLRAMDGDSPYQVSRLEHCLQTATRAENDGADDETIACALLHDIGDILAPANHSGVAAAMLARYVSEKNRRIVKHRGLFLSRSRALQKGTRSRYSRQTDATKERMEQFSPPSHRVFSGWPAIGETGIEDHYRS